MNFFTNARGWEWVLWLGVLWLGAGCVNYREKIELTSEPPPHFYTNDVPTTAATSGLTKAAEAEIREVIFSELLEHHFEDAASLSAIFVQADSRLETALIRKYPRHQPPIKPAYRAFINENQSPLDRDNNRPAMLLSVEVSEPEKDGSVMAIGRWYCGGAVAGFYTYRLKPTAAGWIICSTQ